MLSEGCHSFDLSFLFFLNPPTFSSWVGKGSEGDRAWFRFRFFGIVKVKQDFFKMI